MSSIHSLTLDLLSVSSVSGRAHWADMAAIAHKYGLNDSMIGEPVSMRHQPGFVNVAWTYSRRRRRTRLEYRDMPTRRDQDEASGAEDCAWEC